jgi:hypothetical protein
MFVAWLLDDSFVLGLKGVPFASVHPDGSVYSPDLSTYVGAFVDGFFRDTEGLPVAFVDRTLEQNNWPTHDKLLSPLLAQRIANWSPTTWQEFLDSS